ncbi:MULTISPECIES: hypothetical protein [Paenibacillus]|uniref:hypothetical protein n=1 Tax=Paenibacillus TaxID=44249 RepID=UPI0022B90345|nr:hypothetical protein [Paenibacillus caseinilyticus]MCZ8522001.1 hypothetical protein [Paenibacillus caseinilyticus]
MNEVKKRLRITAAMVVWLCGSAAGAAYLLSTDKHSAYINMLFFFTLLFLGLSAGHTAVLLVLLQRKHKIRRKEIPHIQRKVEKEQPEIETKE